MTQRFYVTTPIYYVNGSPHIGHAYTTVVADALARYRAMRGAETRFLTGTDEHGLKLQREAEKRGMAVRDFVDETSGRFRALWPQLLCRPDDFIRTTEERHRQRVQDWWRRCRDNGDIYLGRYKGLYCVACEGYKTEKELLPGRLCPTHERPIEELEEETYFFRLSKYQDRLLALYRDRPSFVQPETRRNEVLSFVAEGLDDLSISRTTFSWGIPVPDDPRHVVYVWFDALFNYRTALDSTGHEAFWPPDVQLVAKDILRFHTVYWPAFLMSAGLPDDQLPRTVFTHGFLLSGGRKTSKTQGLTAQRSPGTTDPARIAAALGPDALRFYLLREVAFGQDGEFSIPGIISRARSELAETVGNLLHRALPFTRHFDAKVPYGPAEKVTAAERELVQRAATLARESAARWDALEPHRALELTIELARAGNKYFDEQAPWKLAKAGDPERLAVVIAHVLELVRVVSTLLWPATPKASDALRAQLGLDPLCPREGADLWPLHWGGLAANQPVAPGAPVFPKYDPTTEAALLKELDVVDQPPAPTEEKPVNQSDTKPDAPAPAATAPAAPATPAEGEAVGVITYDDFARSDLRVGKVLSAERIPRKDMLLKLSVDLGEAAGPRTIIAGIALSYAPDTIVGRQVIVVSNLAPRDFGKGLVSHGMLLAAGAKDSLALASFDKDVAPGTRVK